MKKIPVIIVTDGDGIAKKSIEIAAKNIGGRSISRSAGNPTPITGKEIIKHINEAIGEPVVVMVDDKGDQGIGKGEHIIKELVDNESIEVIGVVAVASNTVCYQGAKVHLSIDKNGQIVHKEVDKHGDSKANERDVVRGDTVQILGRLKVPLVVGIGDPGKMDGKDKDANGAPVTTKALEIILDHYKQNSHGG